MGRHAGEQRTWTLFDGAFFVKILVIDIETRPSLAHVWGLWDQNVGLSQLVEVGSVICWAAKWVGKRDVFFMSDHHDGHEKMLQGAWDLMSEADCIVHYNGKAFDVKHLNREFLLAGMTPPSPHKDIDLLTATRSRFKFASNKLDHVAQQLGLGSKTQHSGFELWVGCMQGDEKSWNLMRRYNKQDVRLTEKLYKKLLPWIKNHPSPALFSDYTSAFACKQCGSEDLERRGYAYTSTTRYRQLQCRACGAWNRSIIPEGKTIVRQG